MYSSVPDSRTSIRPTSGEKEEEPRMEVRRLCRLSPADGRGCGQSVVENQEPERDDAAKLSG